MLDCFCVSLLSSCHYKRKTFLDLAWTFKLKCWNCFSAADSGSSYIVSMKPLPLRPLGIADWITVMLSVIGRDQLQREGLRFQLIHSSSGHGSQIPRITLFFTVVPSSAGLIGSVLLQRKEQHVLCGLRTQSLHQIDFCRPQSAHGHRFLTLGIHYQVRNQTDAFTLTSNHALSLSHYGHHCPSVPLPLVFKASKHHLLLAFVSLY